MKKSVIYTILTLCALPCALWAGAVLPENDNVFKAMKDELARSMDKLRMDSLAKPYFLDYQVVEGRSLGITAGFGAVESEYTAPYRRLRVNLRVGSPAFDNSNYAPNMWEGCRVEMDWSVALEDNYDSLRYSIWAATDKAYKKALETHSKKKAYKESKNITELFDDMTPRPPYQLFRDAEQETLDSDLWRENIRKVSAVFLKYPAVKYSTVRLNFRSGDARFLDSEGSAFKRPDCLGSVIIEAKAYAPDGFPLSAGDEQYFCLAKDAPGVDKLMEKAEEAAKRLSGMDRSVQIKAYIGPVLFEKDAAGKFFDYFLVANLSNPREVWTTPNNWSSEAVYRRPGALVERLDMRVLSPFLNVTDEPSERYFEDKPLIGYYEVDDEGVPARKLNLVGKGKLLDYYMSRAATRDFKKSNGHGRADFSDYASGSPSNVFIRPEAGSAKVLPLEKLRKKLIDVCREQELEYCLIIRGLDNIRAPFAAYRVYVKDGHEEPVHGLEFTGTSLRALRDIAAVSKEMNVYYPHWSTPGSIISPSILVAEMEVKKTDSKPEKIPYLPHPYFAK
ncbi:MAG: hypothetical protein KKH28_09045 [Elusimicrobia bacterium]|nr:hypothetical protein [Elusimicrobiota bacterium]